MLYNPQKHNRHTIRLRNYRYDTAGGYAVTICAFQREQIFGNIENGVMQLNESGKAVEAEWFSLVTRYSNIVLDEFILMPNHLHGIVFLSSSTSALTVPPPTLGTVIGAFKSLSSRACGQQSSKTTRRVWQRNYYEQIIRSEAMLDALRLYIAQNPANWQNDPENSSPFNNDLGRA